MIVYFLAMTSKRCNTPVNFMYITSSSSVGAIEHPLMKMVAYVR